MKALVFFLFSLYFTNLKGQNISNPYQNPIILNHYTVQDLQALEQSDTVKFNSINYYYTASYIFEQSSCTECTPLPASSFDVSQYEYLRLKSKRFTRDFWKYGFKLTLLSIDELTYKLPIHYTK